MGGLDEILQRHPVWRGGALARGAGTLPSGWGELDAQLPGAGWPLGGITELLCDDAGIGELELLLPVLAQATQAGRPSVWLAPPHMPYAPALAAAGVDVALVLVVRPAGRQDALWAAEQALRSRACQVLLAWLPRPRYAELQRLALAAEAGGAAAFCFRPQAAALEASPACLRLALAPLSGALAVEIVKRRGAPAPGPLVVPLKRPFHAVDRAALPGAAAQGTGHARRLGLAVHA